MTSKAEQEEHEKRSEAAKKAAETRAKNRENGENGENGEEHVGPTGATLTAAEPRRVEPETLAEAGEPQPNPNTYDDGVEDVELGPPLVGQFVRITSGDYAGRVAVYLGDVSYEDADDEEATPYLPPTPAVIQVRTRDAENLTIDVPYSDVSSTTYSGGR